ERGDRSIPSVVLRGSGPPGLTSDYGGRAFAPARGKEPMSTYEQIGARELKPGLLELDGISRETIEAHYRLFHGYVPTRKEILGKLDEVDRASANQVYSDLRS